MSGAAKPWTMGRIGALRRDNPFSGKDPFGGTVNLLTFYRLLCALLFSGFGSAETSAL